jgi:formate dehydrogenase major subunit/formate dehydrogenase alpha subunit
MTLHLTIDAQPVAAEDGQTVLAAARAAGIVIPTLCDHPALAPVGSCRLCLVEVEGQRAPVAACTLPVAAGQVVRTETPALVELRRAVLELLLQNYRDSDADGGAAETEFQHWVRHYGLARPAATPRHIPVDSDPNPFIRVDWNQCILCTRCVRACAEVQGRFVWGVAGRGATTRIVAGAETSMLDARCESCGLCAAVCPTGALTDRLAWGQGTADRQVTTTCGYCGWAANSACTSAMSVSSASRRRPAQR